MPLPVTAASAVAIALVDSTGPTAAVVALRVDPIAAVPGPPVGARETVVVATDWID